MSASILTTYTFIYNIISSHENENVKRKKKDKTQIRKQVGSPKNKMALYLTSALSYV